VHLEEFAEGTTLLHRVDPRVKFLAGGPLMLMVAVMTDVRGPLVASGLAGALAIMARLDGRKLLVRLAAVNAFVLLVWVFLPVSLPGETILALGPVTVSREGVAYALGITLKANAIVLLTIAVLGTSDVMSLAHALVHLRAPRKLVYLFFFFYRYVSVLHEEYTRLRRAMAVRGFRPRTDSHTYRSFGTLVGMLLVRSHERSERVYRAMLCRGFHGHFPVARHFHLHRHDLAFGAAMLGAAALLVYVGSFS
jgi:cobalt/nickel transport system permease protein